MVESCFTAPRYLGPQDPTATSDWEPSLLSLPVHLCSLRLWGRGSPLCAEPLLAADLLASCRGLGGLLSPLALIKQPPPLRPVPAAALPTAWAEFMTSIHQIRRDGDTGLHPLRAECGWTALQAPLPAEQTYTVMLGIFRPEVSFGNVLI